jgi:hypothetical protein
MAFAEADFDAPALEDDKHHPPGGGLADDHRGGDSILPYLLNLAELSGGTFKAEPLHILGDDAYGVAIQHSTAARDDNSYNSLDVLVTRIQDGGAVESWLLSGNPYEFDALLSSEHLDSGEAKGATP